MEGRKHDVDADAAMGLTMTMTHTEPPMESGSPANEAFMSADQDRAGMLTHVLSLILLSSTHTSPLLILSRLTDDDAYRDLW